MLHPSSRLEVGRFIARRPYLFALLLTLRNRLSRLVARRFIFVVGIAASLAVMVGIVLAAYLTDARQINSWLSYAQAHGSWLMLLAALQAATTVARRRKQLDSALRDSWLATTQRAQLTMRSSLIVGVLSAPLIQLAIVIALFLVLQYVGRGDAVILHQLMSITIGGFTGGMLLGSVFSTKQNRQDHPGSRYVPGKKWQHSHRLPTLHGLSRWSIARTFAWATPDTVRWPLMAAMLSVMSGSSAVTGLSVVGFWMLVLYMVTLCTSTLRVADEAALWLRTTPLSFQRFSIAVGGRSFIHQFIATTLLAILLTFDRLTAFQAALFVAPWIAFILMAYSTQLAYSFNSRRGARVSMALSALCIAIAEAIHRGAAVPFALLVCMWQMRRVDMVRRAGVLHDSV